jgi:lipopolysaccharide assembly outer membrane protein LptD (OstA)
VDTRFSLSGSSAGGGETAGQPWRVSLSHRYAESRSSSGTRKTSWLSGTVAFPLTDHWRVDYSARYDIAGKKMVSQRVEFYRDLHCWEARFVWEPTGYRQGYYVRINIKAIPEIKLERIKGITG